MMQYQDSAQFVYSIAKRARKYYLGLTTATQDVEDFLKTDYGKAVLTNSSIQILLKQGTAEVDMVGETFYLSEGERELLLSANVGEGLFFAGQSHVALKVMAAPFENDIITSNPAETSRQQKAPILTPAIGSKPFQKSEEPSSPTSLPSSNNSTQPSSFPTPQRSQPSESLQSMQNQIARTINQPHQPSVVIPFGVPTPTVVHPIVDQPGGHPAMPNEQSVTAPSANPQPFIAMPPTSPQPLQQSPLNSTNSNRT